MKDLLVLDKNSPKSKSYTMSQEMLKVSVDLCNDALSSDQAPALALKESGVHEPEVGNYIGALHDLKARIYIDPHDGGILNQQSILDVLKPEKYEDILSFDFNKARGLVARNVDVVYGKANASWRMNDDHHGASEVLDTDDCDINHTNYSRQQGIVKNTPGDCEGPLQDLDIHNELEPDTHASTLFQNGKRKYLHGDFEGALYDLSRANMFEPNNPTTLRYCGIVKFYIKDYKAALKDLDKSNELEANNWQTLSERGRTKHFLGDRDGALLDLDKSNDIDPNNCQTLTERSRTRYYLGDHEGALLDLNKANGIKTNDVFILRNRAFINGTLGDYEGALRDANKAYELCPDILSLKCRAFARYLLKDWQRGAHDIQRALELDPNNIDTLQYQADLKRVMGDYHGAIDVLDKAHQLQPSEVYTLKYRANMKYLLHDFQGSLHDLDKAHALQPQDPYILKERVALKVMMKDYQGAMGDLERAHQLDRDEFTHGMRRGVQQNSQQYLTAMASLLQKVLHNRNLLEDEDIAGLYKEVSSQMSFLLEATTIVFQMWAYCAVIVIFVFKYLMGYVERGQWGTYSNGSWEFRATYVCIELRLGAYPFQKFRSVSPHHGHVQDDQPMNDHRSLANHHFQQQIGDMFVQSRLHPRVNQRTKWCGIHLRRRRGKQSTQLKYEPRVSSRRDKLKRIYLGEYQSLEDAILIRDVAHFCLGKAGPLNLDPILYENLEAIPEGLTQRQIHKLVLERAKQVDHSAFKNSLAQEISRDVGGEPSVQCVQSNQQELEHNSSHFGSDIGELNSTNWTSFESHVATHPQDEVFSSDVAVIMSNTILSTPEETWNLDATTEHALVGDYFEDANFRTHAQNVDTHEERTSCANYDQFEVGGGNMLSKFEPFYGPIPHGVEVWTRQIIIKAPVGTNFLQHEEINQESVFAPHMLCAFSTLEIFEAKGWTVCVSNWSTPLRSAYPSMSNSLEKTPNSCQQYLFRVQKFGTREELAISDSIRTALDKLRNCPGWIVC